MVDRGVLSLFLRAGEAVLAAVLSAARDEVALVGEVGGEGDHCSSLRLSSFLEVPHQPFDILLDFGEVLVHPRDVVLQWPHLVLVALPHPPCEGT